MMSDKPKIRKALFIGLGGTGAMSLIALKKRFMEVYGHVDAQNASLPEFVKFMVFDTDAEGTRNKSKAKTTLITGHKPMHMNFSDNVNSCSGSWLITARSSAKAMGHPINK
ncbi:tubulin-like doman-containing protein [bacterium]|nr:tubulin-like doman-containing protein [bacterium]